MPHVKNLIAENPTTWLSILVEKYKIDTVWDNQDNPRLVSLKYNMIESPMADPIVQECRGMVVDTKSNQILAHGYNKFFNQHEGMAAPIDWETARCLEKADGSLMQLYWDPEKDSWQVSSSGNPIANGTVWPGTQRFAELFWEVFDSLKMEVPLSSHRGNTFMFELCTANNRIVVRYDQPRIVLHGGRELATEEEWNPKRLEAVAKVYNWELIKSYPLNSVEAAMKAATELNPMEVEGFVVVDGNFNRIKIKSPRYVALHHLKDGSSPRRVVELWKAGEVSELLSYFPEMEPDVTPVVNRLEDLAVRAWNDIILFGEIPDRKTFASKVKDRPWANLAFKMYQNPEASPDLSRSLLRAQPVATIENMFAKLDVFQ